MIQSLFSSFNEVAHILPVKTLHGDELHTILKKVILRLEEIGYRVVAIVCDNNALNRKAMKAFFAKAETQPCLSTPSRPISTTVLRGRCCASP